LSKADLERELVALKQQPATVWMQDMDSQALQQTLRDLDSAYQHFFRRVKNGDKKKGFPTFKSRKTDTPRFRISQRVRVEGSFVRAPKIGMVRARIHRPLEGTSKSATFKQEPDGHWYVCLVTEQSAPDRTERPVQSHVGVDLGLKTFAVMSDGQEVANPRYYRTQMRKLRRANQTLHRRVTGSANRMKARHTVARLHQKTRNLRADFLHKLTTDLADHADLISIEDLAVRGLAKTKLSMSVLDASWGMFRQLLTYKADHRDRYLMVIGRFYPSSRLCPACGAINSELTLADRTWVCGCGVRHDRDLNAARNIDQEGMRLFEQHVAAGYAETQNACGDSVSPADR